MAKADQSYAGLRVGVKNGGCAGQEYMLSYAEAAEPLDEIVEDKGVTVFIEPKSVLFLIGSEIDYETTRLASKFVFRNPNETDAAAAATASPSSRRRPKAEPWVHPRPGGGWTRLASTLHTDDLAKGVDHLHQVGTARP